LNLAATKRLPYPKGNREVAASPTHLEGNIVSDLSRLQGRFRERRHLRKHYLALEKSTGRKGYARAAARNGRAMRKLRGLISQAKRVALRHDGTLAGVRIKSTALGPRHWGGGADLMGQFVAPFMAEKFGLAKGSGKRTPQHNAAIGGSPTSDHLTTNRDTFARDFPTFSGHDAAKALAAALGFTGWQENSYATFEVSVDDHTFRVQILWGAGIDHGDHVHVGIELVA